MRLITTMKKEIISVEFTRYAALTSLPTEDRSLIALAKEQLDIAYAPYSNFHVGAALVLENGVKVTGCNQENASYPLCTCGEHNALVSAGNGHPGIRIVTLAIVARNPNQPVNQPVTPCGACRQIIAEFEVRQEAPIRLLLQGETGDIYEFESVKGLLPLSFDRTFL